MGESSESPMAIQPPEDHLKGGDMGAPSVESFTAMLDTEEDDYGNNGMGGSFIALLAMLYFLKAFRRAS